jgi:hypothetical protein
MGAGLGGSQVLLRGVSAWHTPRRAGRAGLYLTTVGRPKRFRTPGEVYAAPATFENDRQTHSQPEADRPVCG